MYISKASFKKLALILVFAISLISCSNKKISQPTVFNNEVVWQYSNYLDGLHESSKNKLVANDFFIVRVGGSLTLPLVSYPIIGKGYMIIMDKKGTIARVNNTTTIDWKYTPNQKFGFLGDYLNGGLSQNEDKIYATYGTNLIHCIDSRTGKLIWNKTLQEVVRAYPMVSKDVIFLQTLNNGVYALNAENGDIIWYKAGLEKGISMVNVISPILYPRKDWLITQGNTGNLTIINTKTGLEEWSVDNEDNMYFDAHFTRERALIYQPIIINDDLYFYSPSGYCYKLSLQNKKIVWKAKLNIDRPFYILGNIIVAIDEANDLVAINTDNGLKLWNVKLNNYLEVKERRKARYWNLPIIIGKNVYVLSSKGELLSFELESGKFIDVIYKMGYGSYIPPIYIENKVFIISAKHLLKLPYN